MIEAIHQQRDVDSQHIPIDTLQRIQRIVLEETQGGRTIIRNLVSIMNGDDPDGKPSHRLQSARILLRLGFEEAREALGSSGHQRNAASQQDEMAQDGSQPAQQPLSPEHEKVNKKLVARIRVDSEGGASMVRVLLEILEGNDPDARTRDRIEAAKVLLHWGFGNPAQPDPDFMMFYAPCHPDCLCVCKDLDEDHPDVHSEPHAAYGGAARGVGEGAGDTGASGGDSRAQGKSRPCVEAGADLFARCAGQQATRKRRASPQART